MPKPWLQERTIKSFQHVYDYSLHKRQRTFVKYTSFILPLGSLTTVLALNIQKN